MFLVRSDDISGAGEYPGKRPIKKLVKNGFIVLDKWPGPTSHDVSSHIKKIFDLKRAAHVGTLDPGVSGILVVLLDNAVKVTPALQKQDKEYVGLMKLHKDVDDKILKKAVRNQVGEIKQLPPVRSAVARKERKRRIHSFKILERDGRNVLFQVSCEAGTYVRVLCHAVGKEVGGAHMAELRRIRSGSFKEKQTVRIQDLVDAWHAYKEDGDEKIREYVMPVEKAVDHLRKIILKDSAVYPVSNGSPLYAQGISKAENGIEEEELVALLTLKGELVAIGKAVMKSEDMVKKRGIAAKPDRVIIEKGLYKK